MNLYIERVFLRNRLYVLDVGCGNGSTVHYLKSRSFYAFGIDIEFKNGEYLECLKKNGDIKLIKIHKNRDKFRKNDFYQWPMFNNKFDFIISRAVIEHVSNIDAFISNCIENLNHNGKIINYYPSKYSLIEPHTGVLFGGLIQNKLWYLIFCSLCICYRNYHFKPNKALNYIKNYTFYRKTSILDNIYSQYGFQRKSITNLLIESYNPFFYFVSKFVIFIKIFEIFRSVIYIYERK